MFSQCFRVSVTCHLRRYVFEIPALTGLRTGRSRFRSSQGAPFLSGTCCEISDLHFGSIGSNNEIQSNFAPSKTAVFEFLNCAGVPICGSLF